MDNAKYKEYKEGSKERTKDINQNSDCRTS
jgi:hypothetical protein